MPIFERLSSFGMMAKTDCEKALQQTVEQLFFAETRFSEICSIQPRLVMENRSFIIDTNRLKAIGDLLADDLGSWKNNGQHVFMFARNLDDEPRLIRLDKTACNSMVVATVHRTYYVNKSEPDFRKIVSFVTDKNSNRLPLTKIEYQFRNAERRFEILSHGNSNCKETAYKRTQQSTTVALKSASGKLPPRKVFDEVSESVGGIGGCSSVGSLPRNMKQVYYHSGKENSAQSIKEDYGNLVLLCKEQMKNPGTAFIQMVSFAPEPISIIVCDQQMKEISKFCTNPLKFSIFQADPTFNLGDFSVTTTVYEHLFLIDRSTGKPPSLLGPIFIHQKKEKKTYSVFTEFLANKCSEFRKLCFIGTDGEEALIGAFKDTCPESSHLRCFIHFRKNVTAKLKDIGIPASCQKEIIADILGVQKGELFEEGIVDATNDMFAIQFYSLEAVWTTKYGKKGTDFFHWCKTNKFEIMKNNMLQSVRTKAGLGSPPAIFTTNRVESMNSILKLESERKKLNVCDFANLVKTIVERQQRNVLWAVIGKGNYKLHPSLSHLSMPEDVWMTMTEKDRFCFLKNILENDLISLIQENMDTSSVIQEDIDATIQYEEQESNISQSNQAPFEDLMILAKAAEVLQYNDEDHTSIDKPGSSQSLTISYDRFTPYFRHQPESMISAMYEKAVKLRTQTNSISLAPGCSQGSRMVESTSQKGRPHLVLRGKTTGDFKCEKSCPSWNAIKVCSHVLATADENGELKEFLAKLKPQQPNIQKLIHTDMPANPGKKGGKGHARKKNPVPVIARQKRTYAEAVDPAAIATPAATSTPVQSKRRTYNQVANTNPFTIKPMNNRIQVCQGCRGSMRSDDGSIPPPPYNYCVARRERRPYTDKHGNKKLASTPCDTHYHINSTCLPSAFDKQFLQFPEDFPDNYKEFLNRHL